MVFKTFNNRKFLELLSIRSSQSLVIKPPPIVIEKLGLNLKSPSICTTSVKGLTTCHSAFFAALNKILAFIKGDSDVAVKV